MRSAHFLHGFGYFLALLCYFLKLCCILSDFVLFFLHFSIDKINFYDIIKSCRGNILLNICGGAFIFSLCKAVFCEQMFLPKKGGGTLNFESGRWFQNSAAAEIFLRKGKAHKNPRRHGCSARKAIQKENLFYGSRKGERKGKTVMSTAPNKTYYIRSALSLSKRLNLYSSGSASDGMNVVLYTDDNSNEQKWYFDGDRLRPKTDTSFCLDRYTASAYLNNADIWKASASDAAAQLVDILPTDNYYFIRLRTPVNGKYYFLTAYNNANGGGGKGDKAENSDGNVYWHTYLGDGNRKQYWSFEECSGSSSGDGTAQHLALPMDSCTVTVMYQDDSNPAYKHEWEAGGHFGLDMIGTPNTPYASGNGTVVGVGGSKKSGVGYWVAIRYDNVYAWNNENENISIIPSIIMRYYHLSSNSTLNVGDTVSFGTTIGTYGHTGVWYDKMKPHLHLEVDTDIAHPLYTPTLTGNAGGLYAGTRGSGDTTFDPCTVFFVKNGTKKQTLSYSQSYCDKHPNLKESYINVSKIEKLQSHTQS